MIQRQCSPLMARKILSLLSKNTDKEYLLGDFEEFYSEMKFQSGMLKAGFWYWRQVLKFLPHFIQKELTWRIAMAGNFIKMAFRNMGKHKGYAFINILGLSVGLACCMVIILYVTNESSYDAYHKNADRLYRILEYRKVPAGEFISAGVSAVVTTVLREQYSQVECAARVFPTYNVLVSKEDKRFFENQVAYVDPELFTVLTIPFAQGDPSTALTHSGSVVISQRIASKYFGKVDPVGKLFTVQDPRLEHLQSKATSFDYRVAGVVENPPANTHFKYDILMSIKQFDHHWIMREWHAGSMITYIKLAEGTDRVLFEKEIARMAYRYVNKDLTAWGQTREYFLQPFLDVHFQREARGLPIRRDIHIPGNRTYLTIYGIIAFLVLCIGCMNFINLSNARAVYRIKEVGLRKVVGAGRWQLMRQFLAESVLVTICATFIALLLTWMLLPFFNNFAQSTLTMADLIRPLVIASTTTLVIMVGILAGLYPAFILTAFKPDTILRGTTGSTRGSVALKFLVIGQFAISIFLAIGTLTVYQQLHYMKSGNLGFNTSLKYVVPFRANAAVRKQVKTLKTEYLNHPHIVGATASSSVPGHPVREGFLKWSDDKLDKPLRLQFLSCDDAFLHEYRIEMIAGRYFNESLNDENGAFIINEAAVSHLGYESAEAALGDRLHESYYSRWKTIVGVATNFHFHGMRREVEPMYMEVSSSRYNALTLSLSPGNLQSTLRDIQGVWERLFPMIPFDGFFLDEDFNRLYRKETQMGKLLSILTGMGLIVACLGLLGLAAFLTQHRTKEIGIRKVLGATMPNLTGLLTRQFMLLVLSANCVAVPAAYWALSKWLENFAYRIELPWLVFLLSGGAALFIAFLVVGFQALRAVRQNPVDSLRYE